MERTVRNLFSEQVLWESAHRFGANPGSLRLLSDVENFVYEGDAGGALLILRITHSSHRTVEAILGELDWIAHLRAHGISVPPPIRSVAGEHVEVVITGDTSFAATAFEKASGENIIEANRCTPEMYEKWGRVLGRMHALAKGYAPRNPLYRRAQWFEDDLVVNAEKYIPGQDTILEKYRNLTDYLHTLPRDQDSYGLIHADCTDVNFFVHDGEITVFDLDDCQYHWFLYDIAVILFDTLPWLPHHGMDKEGFGCYFWRHFMRGYGLENALDPSWLSQLSHFLRLREMNLYLVFHKKWDLDSLQEWQADRLKEFKYHLENDVPYTYASGVCTI